MNVEPVPVDSAMGQALQWALPEALEVPPDQLRLRLDFYQDSILLHAIEDGVVTYRLVSAVDITRALTSTLALGSGILPPDALWWQRTRDGDQVAIWRPPQRTRVALQLEPFQPPERFVLPLPGLVFLCQAGRPPWVWAAASRPVSPEETLFQAPLFNVFSSGLTCQGSHQYGPTLAEVPAEFFRSFFSVAGDRTDRSRMFPGDLLALWRHLNGRRRYPVSDLIPWGTVARALGGGR